MISRLWKAGVCCVIVAPSAAFAHVGHVGELAGHGHLIGLTGLAAAAAMAALLAKLSKDKIMQDDQAEENGDSRDEGAGENGADTTSEQGELSHG